MIKISERLKTAASLVHEGYRLADVGTDHGYVPIYLLQQGRIPRAIAMDINRGPLDRAKEHIALYQMENYIETRLSDGVEALHAGEADTILIAGMGGGLVIHILTDGAEVCRQAKELVLQPQSELARVRGFLFENGYVLDEEAMVKEDGKYYPMMRVHYDANFADKQIEPSQVQLCYGKILLEQKNPVLLDYLNWERGIQESILEKLKQQPQNDAILARIREVEDVLAQNGDALAYY